MLHVFSDLIPVPDIPQDPGPNVWLIVGIVAGVAAAAAALIVVLVTRKKRKGKNP